MSFLGNILDRKLVSTLLDIDRKFENIVKEISDTNKKFDELANDVKKNTERIVGLETDLKNFKEYSPEIMKNVFLENFDKKHLLWSTLNQSKNRELPPE